MARQTDGTLLGRYEVNHKIIGAGGFVIGGGIADDGTLAIHCDTACPYIRKPSAKEWTKLFRPGDNYLGSMAGMVWENSYALAIAPSDSDVVGFVISGYLFRTTDGGATVVKTPLPQLVDADANNNAGRGNKFAIDPVNPSVWWLQGDAGLMVSNDMFDTWSTISTSAIPAPGALQRYYIAFDRHSAVSGGKTQGVYVHVPGHGLYHTTNAGTTWAQIAGVPGAAGTLAIDPSNGYVHYCASGGDGRYYRWDGSSVLAPVNADSAPISGIAAVIDLYNPGHMYLTTDGSQVVSSTDFGLTWGGQTTAVTIRREAANIKWQAWTNEVYMSFARMFFDPSAEGRMYLFEGLGVWYTDNPPEVVDEAHPITWHEHSVGIENMSGGVLMISPEGTLGYSCQDRVGFGIPKADIGKRFPATHGPGNPVDPSHALNRGHGMDWAFGDPSFLAMTSLTYGLDFGGYSTNRGRTWNRFAGDVAIAAGGAKAVVTGSISGTTLTVTAVTSGTLAVGMAIDWTDGGLDGVRISNLGTGSGGVGTYNLSASRTTSSRTITFVEYAGQRAGGTIAALSKDVFIQAQANSGRLMYTLDRGATWSPFALGPGTANKGSYGSMYLVRRVLVKDAHHENVAYFYNIGDASNDTIDLASRGVWKIVYHPDTQTFTNTRVRGSWIGSFGGDSWNGKLVQYGDGHWLWCAGDGGLNLYESKDDMVTWTPVTGADDINGDFGRTAGFFGYTYAAAVGRGALPGDPKSVMVVGHRPPTLAGPSSHDYYGYWLCRNFTDPDTDRLWERIAKFPGGNYGQYYGIISDAVGCPLEFGTFYIANGGSGVFMLKLEDKRRAWAGSAPAYGRQRR